MLADVDEGGAAFFSCASCLRARWLPDGLSVASLSRCCDVPDAQVVMVCGGARVASQLLQAGVATQVDLAALGVDLEGGSELLRVARAARVNADALLEWVTYARGRELDEVMHDVLAPPLPEQRAWDVALLFSRLEERAGVSTPADLIAAPIETTLLPALQGLNLTARDLVLMRAKAKARLAQSPPWMALAKLSFPTSAFTLNVDSGGAVSADADTVDVGLLGVALQTMQEHPNISAAGESVRYLYRISCNVVDSPGDARYRRLRVDNRAYVAHVLGVRGASLGFEALGWVESPDGSTYVLPEDAHISSATTDIIMDCMKGLIAQAASQTVGRKGHSPDAKL